jgi:hypothetical protein
MEGFMKKKAMISVLTVLAMGVISGCDNNTEFKHKALDQALSRAVEDGKSTENVLPTQQKYLRITVGRITR